jgi:hypothetical protein
MSSTCLIPYDLKRSHFPGTLQERYKEQQNLSCLFSWHAPFFRVEKGEKEDMDDGGSSTARQKKYLVVMVPFFQSLSSCASPGESLK